MNKEIYEHSRFTSIILVVAASILLVWISFGSGYVSAETDDQRTKGLTLSPLRTELEISPGTSQDKTVSITNTNKTSIKVRLSAEEFSVINQQYDYAFNVETQLIKWITFASNTIDLAVGETKEVSYRVGVPISAEPGGRYISLFASTDADTSDAGNPSVQRIASLLYINVSGDVTRKGNLVSLHTPWFMYTTTNWTAQLQNIGTTHFRSRYSVTIQSLIGDNTIATKEGDALILPGTVRAIKNSLPSPAIPGVYKVTYSIGLGDTPAYVDTRIIIYFPPAAIIVTIFGLILALSLASEFHRRKKKS